MPEVVEDVERGVVIVDGREIKGHVLARLACPACGRPRVYHDRFDSYFCALCNCWLESTCSDSACEFCRARPAAPLT